MKQIIYSHLLIRLARLLIKYAPDECITSIYINKVVEGLKHIPELTISHFSRAATGEEWGFISGKTEKVDGVDVTLRYFDKGESGCKQAEPSEV